MEDLVEDLTMRPAALSALTLATSFAPPATAAMGCPRAGCDHAATTAGATSTVMRTTAASSAGARMSIDSYELLWYAKGGGHVAKNNATVANTLCSAQNHSRLPEHAATDRSKPHLTGLASTTSGAGHDKGRGRLYHLDAGPRSIKHSPAHICEVNDVPGCSGDGGGLDFDAVVCTSARTRKRQNADDHASDARGSDRGDTPHDCRCEASALGDGQVVEGSGSVRPSRRSSECSAHSVVRLRPVSPAAKVLYRGSMYRDPAGGLSGTLGTLSEGLVLTCASPCTPRQQASNETAAAAATATAASTLAAVRQSPSLLQVECISRMPPKVRRQEPPPAAAASLVDAVSMEFDGYWHWDALQAWLQHAELSARPAADATASIGSYSSPLSPYVSRLAHGSLASAPLPRQLSTPS